MAIFKPMLKNPVTGKLEQRSIWYYEVKVAGRRFRGSTRTTDERIARQVESAIREQWRGALLCPDGKRAPGAFSVNVLRTDAISKLLLDAAERGLELVIRGGAKGMLDVCFLPPGEPTAPQEEADSVSAFLQEWCFQAEDATVNVSFLRHAYKQWCLSAGCEAIDNREFTRTLRMAGFKVKRHGDSTQFVSVWIGVTVKLAAD